MGADRHPPHPLILAGIPLALLFTWTAVADLLKSTPLRDFAAFHTSGTACCDSTSSWYVAPQPDRPNLNPPTTILILFSWMDGWALRSAAVAWTLVGVLAVALVIARILTALALTTWQPVALAVALLASFPARDVWSRTWLGKPDNLSIAGVAARRGWPLWLAVPAFVACVAACVGAWRLELERRWLVGGLITLLASPLGWAYYLPVFVGPLAAVALS